MKYEKIFKKNNLGIGISLIVLYAMYAVIVAGYVGIGCITKPIVDKKAEEKDEEIEINLNSKGIPAYHKLILLKIGIIMFWIYIGVKIAKKIK